MNTPELHLHDTDARNTDDGPWPRLVSCAGDGPPEPCVVCGNAVHERSLMIRAVAGALCDGCSRRLAPEMFDLARHVIGMAGEDHPLTHHTISTLLDWLDGAEW